MLCGKILLSCSGHRHRLSSRKVWRLVHPYSYASVVRFLCSQARKLRGSSLLLAGSPFTGLSLADWRASAVGRMQSSYRAAGITSRDGPFCVTCQRDTGRHPGRAVCNRPAERIPYSRPGISAASWKIARITGRFLAGPKAIQYRPSLAHRHPGRSKAG